MANLPNFSRPDLNTSDEESPPPSPSSTLGFHTSSSSLSTPTASITIGRKRSLPYDRCRASKTSSLLNSVSKSSFNNSGTSCAAKCPPSSSTLQLLNFVKTVSNAFLVGYSNRQQNTLVPSHFHNHARISHSPIQNRTSQPPPPPADESSPETPPPYPRPDSS